MNSFSEFDTSVGWLQNCGIIDYLFSRHAMVMAASSASAKEDLRKMTIAAFSGPFAFFILGLASSAICFCFEVVFVHVKIFVCVNKSMLASLKGRSKRPIEEKINKFELNTRKKSTKNGWFDEKI